MATNTLYAVQVRLLAPTNTRGTRIKLVSGGSAVVLPYDYRYDTCLDQAVAYFTNKGITPTGVVHGSTPIVIFDDPVEL
jgi:hypothetical protein